MSDSISGVNARYPMPAYPRGWYSLIDSEELQDGEIKPVDALGQNFIAVRAPSGVPQVYDAYCPHLGASLAHGGTLEGGQIVCPFHAWRFSTEDGQCQGIPYAKRLPANAGLTRWPTEERNGLILIYFDPNGEAPTWQVDPIPELEDPQWILIEHLEWKIRTHAHEVLENVVDTAHLKYVHGAADVPSVKILDSESPGKFDFEIRSGAEVTENSSDVDVTLWGLGVQRLRYKIQLPVFELDTLLPIDEENVHARTRLYMRDLGSAEANQAVAGEIAKELDRQVQSDIQIFEHKRHKATPLLCDGDGPIPAFRRWTEQFYSRSSSGGDTA